jgi:hypothetical protein
MPDWTALARARQAMRVAQAMRVVRLRQQAADTRD